MEDLKRWIVTYTKHVKQKRKVYQDGFLELHISTNKAKLYDDCEKLLDSRTLKQCEVVSCGETLTFNAYLVDIGEPNRDHRPNLNSHEDDAAFTEKSGVRKDNSIKKEARLSPSPSQKIIREFERRLQNCGSPKSSHQTSCRLWVFELQDESKFKGVKDVADAKSPTVVEWQILYTTQLTQKAKKYHDGLLSVALCGTLARKAKLYDSSRTLLDSRFLRQSELIKSGETMAFEAHLVEIGDPVEKEESMNNLNLQKSYNLNLQKSYGNAVDKTMMIYKHRESLEARNKVMKEKCPSNVGPRKHSSNLSFYTGEEIKSIGANKPLRDSLDILSTLRKPTPSVGIAACDINENITTAPSFSKEPETSEAPGVVILDLCEDDQSLKAVLKIVSEISHCTESSENINQDSENEAKNDPDGREKWTRIKQSTTDCTLPCVVEETKKGVEELKCARETDKCPSFDLGF